MSKEIAGRITVHDQDMRQKLIVETPREQFLP